MGPDPSLELDSEGIIDRRTPDGLYKRNNKGTFLWKFSVTIKEWYLEKSSCLFQWHISGRRNTKELKLQ